MKAFSDCPKVAGSKKGHELVLQPWLRRRHKRLKPDKGFMTRKLNWLVIIKIVGRKRDVSDAILLDVVKNHASFEIVAGMKKSKPVGQNLPYRLLGKKADSAIEVVVKVLQIRRDVLNLRRERLLGKGLGLSYHIAVTEYLFSLSNCPAYRQDREQHQKGSHKRFDDGNTPLIKSNRKIGLHPRGLVSGARSSLLERQVLRQESGLDTP